MSRREDAFNTSRNVVWEGYVFSRMSVSHSVHYATIGKLAVGLRLKGLLVANVGN